MIDYNLVSFFFIGDNPPNTVWEETQERQLYISTMTAKTIEKVFPGVPAYSAIGNHGWPLILRPLYLHMLDCGNVTKHLRKA